MEPKVAKWQFGVYFSRARENDALTLVRERYHPYKHVEVREVRLLCFVLVDDGLQTCMRTQVFLLMLTPGQHPLTLDTGRALALQLLIFWDMTLPLFSKVFIVKP